MRADPRHKHILYRIYWDCFFARGAKFLIKWCSSHHNQEPGRNTAPSREPCQGSDNGGFVFKDADHALNKARRPQLVHPEKGPEENVVDGRQVMSHARWDDVIQLPAAVC